MNKLGKVAVAVAMAFSVGAASAADTRGYVQSGLVAHWDGVENIGRGTHSSDTSVWVDLVAGREFALTGVTVNDDRLTFAGAASSYGELPEADTTATFGKVGTGGTIEIVLKADSTANAIAFQSPTTILAHWNNGLSIVYCGSSNKPELDWCWDGVSTNTVSLYYSGSLVQNAAVDGEVVGMSTTANYFGTSGKLAVIGTRQAKNNYHFKGSIYAIRLYDRELTAAERARNAALDAKRFFRGETAAYENFVVVGSSTEEIGVVSPGYGVSDNLVDGTTYAFTASETALDGKGTANYRCVGWELRLPDGTTVVNTEENVTTCEIEYGTVMDGATLLWKWVPTHYKFDVDVVGGGTVDVESQFVASGGVVTVTATPNDGMKFWKWTGTAATAANRYRMSATVTMSAAATLTANFYDPATTPRIVRYVTPSGAGTKDGTSWENAMNSVATAYTSVGANPGGGEVWLLKGRHNCNSTITMLPNVVIRGGFVGTETDADEADPKANPTIIAQGSYNSGTDTWQYGTPTMWTGEDLMTFVEPEVGDNTPVFGYDYRGSGKLFNNTDGADLGESGLYGLWFHAYSIHVIQMTSANAKPFVIKNCRFTASGWYMHNTDKTINAIDAAVDIEDCEFIGCANTVYLTTSSKNSPVTTNVVKGCRFYTCDWNWNCSPVASGVAACNNAKLILQDSVFDKCRNSSNGGDTRSGAVLLYGVQDALVENCVFRRSMTTTGSRAAAVTITPQTNTFVATFNRCRFENNTYSGSGRDAHNSVGAAIGATGTGRLYVNDSLFVGNVVTNSAYGNPAATCVGLTGSWNGAFANCTFEDNVAIDTTGKSLRYTFTTAWNSTRYFAFANCVFNNNLCGYSNTDVPFKRQSEFRKPDKDNEGQTYSFVNCVFANEAEDYKMFVEGESMSWGDDLAFANCVTSSTNSWGKATKNTFRYEPLDNATLAPLKDYTETNGVTVARGIAETSVYRKKGRPVYRAANGDLYIYDTVFNAAKPWRLLRSPGTAYTPEDGATRGLSIREPIVDAFGEPRSKIKGALGPIDWKLPGMMLLVR